MQFHASSILLAIINVGLINKEVLHVIKIAVKNRKVFVEKKMATWARIFNAWPLGAVEMAISSVVTKTVEQHIK